MSTSFEIKVTRSLDTSLIVQTIVQSMKLYSRKELREFALANKVKRGRNKIDTLKNLIEAGCVKSILTSEFVKSEKAKL